MASLSLDEPLIENRTFADLEGEAEVIANHEFFRCTFRNCRWPKARFNRCAFEACVFDECDLTHLNPMSTSLRGVIFRGCKLLGAELGNLNDNPEVTFERCILRYASFVDINLRGTVFQSCDMQEAQLKGCSLIDADLFDCDLTRASFERCSLAGADLSTCTGVYLDPRSGSLKGAFVPVEAAVMLAQAAGLAVAGYDDPPKRKKRAR